MSNVNTHEKYCLATAVNAAAQTRWFLVPYSDRDSFPPLTEKTKYDRSERDPNQFRLRDRIQYDTVILEDTTEKPQQRINDKTTKKWNKKGNEGGRTAAKFNASNITIEWPGREKMEVEKAQKDTKSDQMMNLQNQQIDIYIYMYWYLLIFFVLFFALWMVAQAISLPDFGVRAKWWWFAVAQGEVRVQKCLVGVCRLLKNQR